MTESEVVRRFNRTYTPRIGALDDSFLGTGLTLASARLLFEIGRDGAVVRDLRRLLGLDSGYLSRLLRDLEQRRLITVREDPTDRRRRICQLTSTGQRRYDALDRRSEDVANDLLGALTATQRRRFVEALATAELMLRAASVSFVEVDPVGEPATAALSRYFDELDERFVGGFDRSDAFGPGVAAMTAPTGAFIVATAPDGTVVGCGGLQHLDEQTAELRRMWICGDWRGAGLGRRLLAELEERSAAIGYRAVVLDTNATLSEAITMYQAAGYTAIDRYNQNPHAHHWFHKTIAEVDRSPKST
jgi:DNA-binding MarR family transcriptional regulator/N-acetylglutamate synthase-like GNAT family acetyltransferase